MPKQKPGIHVRPKDRDYAVHLLHSVCQYAGSASVIEDARAVLKRFKVLSAIKSRDPARIYDLLVEILSFQGISDAVAQTYMDRNGRITWHELRIDFAARPTCPKLSSYWSFEHCHYKKAENTCAMPQYRQMCTLPRYPLRNGRINQMAHSLFLFFRDVAEEDLIGWIDARLSDKHASTASLRDAVISPLRNVYGVSHKVLAVGLSTLLLGAGKGGRWVEVGGSMIAIDTLVHNFLHRTGILRRFNATHAYGEACYRSGSCAEIIESMAAHIDARACNRVYPAVFPRFVQHAIWRYCAQEGLDICNGNRIDDSNRCQHQYCRLFDLCDRVPIRHRP